MADVAQFDPDAFMASRGGVQFDPDTFMAQQNKPQSKEKAPGYFQTLKEDVSSIPGAAAYAIRHPGLAVNAGAERSWESLKKSLGALKSGDPENAAMWLGDAAPILGPALHGIFDDIDKKNYGRAGARITEFLVAKSPEAIAAAPKAAAVVGGAIKGGVKAGMEPVSYGRFNTHLPASLASGYVGGHVGRMAGNMVGVPAAGEAVGMVGGAVAPAIKGAVQGGKDALAAYRLKAGEASPVPSALVSSSDSYEPHKPNVPKYTPSSPEYGRAFNSPKVVPSDSGSLVPTVEAPTGPLEASAEGWKTRKPNVPKFTPGPEPGAGSSYGPTRVTPSESGSLVPSEVEAPSALETSAGGWSPRKPKYSRATGGEPSYGGSYGKARVPKQWGEDKPTGVADTPPDVDASPTAAEILKQFGGARTDAGRAAAQALADKLRANPPSAEAAPPSPNRVMITPPEAPTVEAPGTAAYLKPESTGLPVAEELAARKAIVDKTVEHLNNRGFTQNDIADIPREQLPTFWRSVEGIVKASRDAKRKYLHSADTINDIVSALPKRGQ